jgi:hypothetical protein
MQVDGTETLPKRPTGPEHAPTIDPDQDLGQTQTNPKSIAKQTLSELIETTRQERIKIHSKSPAIKLLKTRPHHQFVQTGTVAVEKIPPRKPFIQDLVDVM